ncbi:Chaperone protein ClpB 1 [Nucleospora cyclopteri]
MNDPHYTNRAQQALKGALDIAQLANVNIVTPEMVLKSLIEGSFSNSLKKTLSEEEREKITDFLAESLSKMYKSSSAIKQPTFGNDLSEILQNCTKKLKEGEFVNVDLIAKNTLEHIAIKNMFISDELRNLLKEVNKRIKLKTEYCDPEADDPEDSMAKYAVEMVQQARENQFDPVIGRDIEIRQIIEILAKKTKSNVIMVGSPGVGKTAIVNGIAQMISKERAKTLSGWKIYNVDVGAMVAGSEYRGAFEKRLKELMKEAELNENVILFIDEIHIVLGAGAGGGGAMDAANLLKPKLASGQIKCIGATTFDEYRKHVSKDPAFERRFVKVTIKEPTISDSITILRGLREKLETHHGVKISDKALVYAATVAKKYIPNRRLPDVAIDLVDTACASLIITVNSEPPEIQELKNRIWTLELEKTSVEIDLERVKKQEESSTTPYEENLEEINREIQKISNQIKPLEEQFFKDKKHLLEAKEIQQRIENAKLQIEDAQRRNDRYTVIDLQTNVLPIYEEKLRQLQEVVEVIQPTHIAEIISRLTGIPTNKLTVKESKKLGEMEKNISKVIFGQDQALKTVCDAITINRMGLGDEQKPIASFLFVGPSGVGKTELSKQICKELNDTYENMVVLDMSDYSNETSINKLIGAPAGYVGYDEGGALTERVKEMPYNVVLLDELDLAHQRVLNVLYQLLDEGRVTDGKGVKVSFRNTVVIMTTNLGQEYAERQDHTNLNSLLTNRFGTALINRIDNVVMFNNLDHNAMRNILLDQLAVFNRKIADKNVYLILSENVINEGISSANSSQFGGRIVKRFIKDNFAVAVSKIIMDKVAEEKLQVTAFSQEETDKGILYGNYRYVIEDI